MAQRCTRHACFQYLSLSYVSRTYTGRVPCCPTQHRAEGYQRRGLGRGTDWMALAQYTGGLRTHAQTRSGTCLKEIARARHGLEAVIQVSLHAARRHLSATMLSAEGIHSSPSERPTVRKFQHAATCQPMVHHTTLFRAPAQVHLQCCGHFKPWDVDGLGSAMVSR